MPCRQGQQEEEGPLLRPQTLLDPHQTEFVDSKGQIAVMTKAYQDMFRMSQAGDMLCCMYRLAGNFKYEHSFSIGNLCAVGMEGGTDPRELLDRLTRRAMFIHKVIS